MNHLKDQRGVAMVLELILVVVVLAIAGFAALTYFHYNKKMAATSPTPSAGPQRSATPIATPGIYAGWEQGSLASEGLSFKYPSNWSVSTNSGSGYTGFLALKDTTGFTIDIDAFKASSQNASLGGSLGATTFNTTVASLQLGGKAAYLIDYLSSSKYSGTVLSSCTGSKKCLYTSPVTGDDIEFTVIYNVPGKTDMSGGPDSFSPSAAGYKEALQIANTLTLN